MKLIWIKWFPTDWLSEGELSKTSLLGRGLWIEALNVMFNSDTYALSGTPDELSRVLRCDVAEFNTALGDLQCHNAAIVGVRNGVVTLTSRRLERLHNKRKNGRLRVIKHRRNEACNAQSASASVSASVVPPGNGDRGKGRNVVLQLQAEIGKHFSRKPEDRWAYDEEFALVDVCKRIGAEAEWLEIIAFRVLASRNGDLIRGSVLSTLQNWTSELDRARNYKPTNQPSNQPKITKASKLLNHAPADSTVSDETKALWEKMKAGLK